MDYRKGMNQRRAQRRRGVGCLLWAVAAVWILLALVLGYRYFVAPRVSQLLAEQINGELAGTPPPGGATQPAEPGSGAVSGAIAALSSGEVRLSEAEINTFIADHAESLRPLDSATVRLTNGEVQATVRVFGLSSTVTTGLAVQNGRIITVNPRIDGPLSSVVSLPDLTGALERQINDQFSAQGRRLSDIRIEEGEIIVKVEG